VPVSLQQERVCRDVKYVQTPAYLKTPPTTTTADENCVLWDIDAAGYAFYKTLLDGSAGYTGPQIDEDLFERIIDKFERAVRADTLPLLQTFEASLANVVPDVSIIGKSYHWWVARRKQLAMPLVRMLRPPPDPEDPDVVCVAFRPRVQEGARRMRSNNKKTFTLMTQLHDEFKRLATLLELIARREKLKLEFHRATGDYTEVAHRTLVHRLGRHRVDPRAGWKEEGAEEAPPQQYKVPAGTGKQPLQPHRSGGSAPRQRDHKKRSHGRKDHGHAPAAAGRGDEARLDQPDSEDEALAQLLFSVDTRERAELEKLLPGHKRPAAAGPSAAAPSAAAPVGTALDVAGESAAAPSLLAVQPEVACAAAGAPPVEMQGMGGAAAGAAAAREPLGGRGGRGRLRGFVRVGRGGRVVFDRGGGSCRQYSRWTPSLADPWRTAQRSEQLLHHILSTGRVCSPSLLERHVDPDDAWRHNKPLKIKQGPLLFDFKWLPRPELVPSQEQQLKLHATQQELGVGTGASAVPEAPQLINGDGVGSSTGAEGDGEGLSKRQKVS
jgi:hypothetical protein